MTAKSARVASSRRRSPKGKRNAVSQRDREYNASPLDALLSGEQAALTPIDLVPGRCRASVMRDEGLTAVLESLACGGMQGAPSVRKAAQIAARSRATFCRHFRKVTGRGWREFVREYFLLRARRELLDPLASIKEVRRKSGYRTSSGFAKAFRRRFGNCPLVELRLGDRDPNEE